MASIAQSEGASLSHLRDTVLLWRPLRPFPSRAFTLLPAALATGETRRTGASLASERSCCTRTDLRLQSRQANASEIALVPRQTACPEEQQSDFRAQ